MIAKTCGRPGCLGIKRGGVCSSCGHDSKDRCHWQSDKIRGTRQERGYGSDWQATRREFIRRKTLEAALSGVSPYPICELCDQPVEVEAEIHVDHIKPHNGLGDPLRLSFGNLRISHLRCHMRLTGARGALERISRRTAG